MKTKLISIIMIISILTSLFSIYSFASDNTEEAETVSENNDSMVKAYLHYRNSYGDDADDFGGSITLANATNSSQEYRKEENGNTYGLFNFNDSSSNVFFQFSPNDAYNISTDKLGYMVYEYDINDFGNMLSSTGLLEIHTGRGSLGTERLAAADILSIGNSNGKNYFYFNKNKLNRIEIPSNEWVHVRCEISILSGNATTYTVKCYIGDKSFEAKTYSLGTPAILTHIRMGCPRQTNLTIGLDNITLYSAPTNISSHKEIGSIGNTIAMKVGAENAKINNVQTELENPPMLVNGEIYCPVNVIEDFCDSTCDSSYLTVLDGVEYIHLESINKAFGLTAKSYDMGLIMIGSEKDVASWGDPDYNTIMDLMKTFVFNVPTPDALKNDVQSYTNNFDHPYLVVDQNRFDELKRVYDAGMSGNLLDPEELALYDYISRYILSANSRLNTYFGIKPTEVYKGLKSDKIPVNTNYNNYNNNGYDFGGRVQNLPATDLYYYAFAYQVTGNLNYARAAYDLSLALGDWNHWGPAHFLNCADAAAPFSISYDWLYDAYKILEGNSEISKYDSEIYSTDKIVKIIFTHAIVPGYIQSNGLSCPWPGSVNSKYSTTTNNWNAVCTSGMVASALAIMGEEISTAGIEFTTQKKENGIFTDEVVSISEIGNSVIHVGLNTYADYAAKLASMNMNTLIKYGLGEYAPDGSYVESPGYWAYGTNTYFRMVTVLLSATGDDYGFMDSWGIDTTCYFAIHSESSDYKQWSFNDGGVGTTDSSYFFFVGNYYNDDNLIKVRKKHLSNGKSYTLFDILFYDPEITGDPELATEYYMKGIDGYAVRSSWDKGAIYAGIMGGPNSVSHGHMDAGAFIYHNNGKIWFHDIGADNYNIGYVNDEGQNKGYFSNYELYRIGAEGHNIIAITSEQDTLPFGQTTTANPSIVKYYSSTEGGYAVIDMSDAYGNHVTSAKRGMLFTDLRSSVIIQDEIVFNGPKTAYWFGHYNIGTGYVDEVVLSSDKKTAFMISGDDIIRVTIVSDNTKLSFEIMDAYTYLLDITHNTDQSTMGMANTETNRDNIRKLAIKCENVETLNLAVVIEEVSGMSIGTSYEWNNIDNWNVDGAKTPETEYKFKADYEDLGMHIGSVTNDLSKEFSFNYIESEDESFVTISSLVSGTSAKLSNVKFNLVNNEPIRLKRYQYAVIDFDIYTESKFVDGTTFGINSSEGFIPILEFSEKSINSNGSIANLQGWAAVTVIFDIKNDVVHVYVNDVYLSSISSVFSTYAQEISSLEFNIPAGSMLDKQSTMSYDNVILRTLGTLYDDRHLSSVLDNKSNLTLWADNISADHVSLPLAITDATYIYDYSALQSAINNAETISLLRDCTAEVSITTPISIDTNGYVFTFKTDSCILDIDNDIYRFENGSIEVTWHVGNTTYTEYCTASKIAQFKYSNNSIGKVTEERTDYADGTSTFRYFTTGWSNSIGGTYLTDEEMIITRDNCEFWLVNNKPLECLFVKVSSSGTVTPYYTESDLRKELSASNSYLRVVLCDDVEIMNTSPLAMATGGKNFYLNNFTLKHAQNDVHMFIYRNAKADFNIYGPGNIVSDGSRTVFTSDAVSTTNNYGIKINGVNISTNVQLVDLRIGQHEFVSCTINHSPTSSKTFVTIWDRNGVSSVTGTVSGISSNSAPLEGTSSNLITVTFKDCNIAAGNTGNSPLVSFTSGTYSEVYFIDSRIVTKGVILESVYSGNYNPDVKISFEGSSVVSAKSISTNPTQIFTNVKFNNGVVTNLNIDSNYMPENAILTSNYHPSLKYMVATEYALVKWLDLQGAVIHEEYVSVGVTPVINNDSVIEYLRSLNSGSYRYSYNAIKVSSKATVDIKPIRTDGTSLLQGMNLATDFALELYIPKSVLDSEISSVTLDGVLITSSAYSLKTIDGVVYYKYRITKINPANAGRIYTVTVAYNNGTVREIEMSVINYLDSLLAISDNSREKTLAIKIIKYLRSASAYVGIYDSVYMEKLNSIVFAYSEYDTLYGAIESQATGTAALRNAISGARLYLSASAKFRFTLNSEFSGQISTEYLGVKRTYQVTNGICDGINYIQLELSASELTSDVSITVDDVTITYNVRSYYTTLNTNDFNLSDMLFCLNEYSQAAKDYLNN